jgi:hypothetical protein
MYQRRECIAKADACRAKAQSDPARFDCWIDEAAIWLQRAIDARQQKPLTHEIQDGRLVPKRAN